MKKHITISTIIMTILLAGFLAAGCGQGNAPREGGEHGDEHAHEEGHEDEGHIELTPEALETIVLIAKGGPFPYSKDGSTFFNREGILPSMPEGYYREYTVETPGSDDRGARRIVGGEAGELYYTDDHYNSFSWIVIE